jgi:hypothetical protein
VAHRHRQIIAVNLAGTMPTERLLERVDVVVAGDSLVRVRQAGRAIVG